MMIGKNLPKSKGGWGKWWNICAGKLLAPDCGRAKSACNANNRGGRRERGDQNIEKSNKGMMNSD